MWKVNGFVLNFPRFFNQWWILKTFKKKISIHQKKLIKKSPDHRWPSREEVSFRYELKCFPRYGLGFQSTTVPQSRDKVLHTSSNDRNDKFFRKTWITFHLEHRVVEKVLKSPSNFHTTPTAEWSRVLDLFSFFFFLRDETWNSLVFEQVKTFVLGGYLFAPLLLEIITLLPRWITDF